MYVELGEKIKSLRKRRCLKQDDIANILKISRGQVSNLEKGRRSINLEQLNILCNFFEIDMSYFLREEMNDDCNNLLDRAKILFESDNMTEKEKDNLFLEVTQIYFNSKEKK